MISWQRQQVGLQLTVGFELIQIMCRLQSLHLPLSAVLLSVDSLPVEFFITDDIIVLLVTETNRYAQQFLAGAALKPNSRARRWTSTDATEMQKFLGMLLTMEIVKKPHIEDYWSTDPLLATPVFNQTMSCDGFELLLKF